MAGPGWGHKKCARNIQDTDNNIMEPLLYVLPVLAFLGLFLTAINRKASRSLRLAARIGLLLAVIAILVCALVLLMLTEGPAVTSAGAVPEAPVSAKAAALPGWEILLLLAAAGAAFILLIVMAARRERRRRTW
jgi:cytochrome bd-type quinol oxidase subunit 2